jgi:peptidoglycan/LPS O-acetylase OafA/YrhL
MTPSTPSPPSRLRGLDGVRGFAILWVLLYQLYALLPKAVWAAIPGITWFAGLGWIGVSVFFALSGYLIIPMVVEQRGQPRFFARFWCRRAFRLLPVYVLLLLCFVVAVVWWPASSPGRERLLGPGIPTWSYFVFLQNFLMSARNLFGNEWLRVTWSLAVEVQFYALICVLVFWIPRAQLVLWLVVMAEVVVLLRFAVVQLNPDAATTLVVWLPCRMDAFLAGGLAAFLPPPTVERMRLRQGLSAGVLGLSILTFCWVSAGGFADRTRYALPVFYVILSVGSAALLDLSALSAPAVKWLTESAAMVWAGKLSYFLYLFHLPVLWFVYAGVFGRLPNLETITSLALMLGVLVLLFGLAEASNRFLEAPLIRRSRGYFKDERAEVVAPEPAVVVAE